MALPKNWGSWESTKKIIRITHNREVRKHFKNVIGDTGRATGRQALKTVLLIKSTDSAIITLNKQVYFNSIKGSSIPIATNIERWEHQIVEDRPQLVIVNREKNRFKPSPITISIPHYNGTQNPIVIPYRKGSYRGVLRCKDGSKLVVNAANETESLRVINHYKRYIKPGKKVNELPTVRKIKNSKFLEAQVFPMVADYYASGKSHQHTPTWRKNF
ncbi:hypothetical protein [Gloeocapsopsis dulcis]|uniref:Uncharacterized protein n=1 Tax=Gloeocapsopsis dulcis AAB1 = 1H9 TaxID=1433147 RepID=A0A6N8G294_9CHRO|nr:hypothetical protein [Gloeocapsopsis dulcis]MUL39311.1 hypothetical protein [Gloeocapsopsis dulcis AAB1 = 1H9]WNN91557.1 hypothetical protein P0S91_10985 [Gloeocapsopsis dulcis]